MAATIVDARAAETRPLKQVRNPYRATPGMNRRMHC